MALINFTVTYDALEAKQPSPVGDITTVALSGTVTFTPQTTMPAQSHGFSPRPAGVMLSPVDAVIDTDGQLKAVAGGTVGVRLLANDPVLGLWDLVYAVSFSLVDSNSSPVMFPSTSFTAPSTDVVVNLVTVMPAPGS